MSEDLDRKVSNYRLLRKIGDGGASEVFLATPTQSLPFADPGTPLAVKLYKSRVLEDKAQRDRIRQEFRVGSQIVHPNLVRIFNFNDGSNGTPAFVVMEYVDGVSLLTWIKMFEPLPGRLVLHIFQQLVDAVTKLHENNIIHRDIKPQNIMIANDFTIKLMDYGVVRITTGSAITDPGKFQGTIRNSSPEYLFGQDYDNRHDIYSLGTVLYALLHGREVFAHEDQFARLTSCVKNDEPTYDDSISLRDDDRSRQLLSLLKRLLSKQPDLRPTIEEIANAIALLAPPSDTAASDPLHAYVATALTGLSGDEAEAITWVSHDIAQIAKQYDVYVYQPRLATDPVLHAEVSPSAVYVLDRRRVASADLLIFLANKPSFGAGQEIEIAASYNKPTLIVAREGTKISRMVLGSFANLLNVIYYAKPEDLRSQLRDVFNAQMSRIRRARQLARRSAAIQVGGRIKELRMAKGYKTVEEMAEAVGMSVQILSHLESGEFDNPGIRLLSYLGRSLGGSFIDLVEDSEVKAIAEPTDPSLRSLEKTAREAGWSTADFLDLRDDYLRQTAASGEAATLARGDWVKRHSALEQRRLEEPEQTRLL